MRRHEQLNLEKTFMKYMINNNQHLEKEMATHSSIQENSMDRGAWWTVVHWVGESDTTERLTHAHNTQHHQSPNCWSLQMYRPAVVIIYCPNHKPLRRVNQSLLEKLSSLWGQCIYRHIYIYILIAYPSVLSPEEVIGNPLQYSCLENSMDRSLAGYSPWSR